MTDETPMLIRPFDPKDEGLIFTSWMKSFKRSEFARCMRASIFFSEHRSVVTSLIQNCTVICAVDPEDPTHVYGWACLDTSMRVPVLHYVFVKPPYRGFGVAKRLLRDLEGRPFFYSHLTYEINTRKLHGTYVPHLAFKEAS